MAALSKNVGAILMAFAALDFIVMVVGAALATPWGYLRGATGA